MEYKNGQRKWRFLQDPFRWNAFSVHEYTKFPDSLSVFVFWKRNLHGIARKPQDFVFHCRAYTELQGICKNLNSLSTRVSPTIISGAHLRLDYNLGMHQNLFRKVFLWRFLCGLPRGLFGALPKAVRMFKKQLNCLRHQPGFQSRP